jgi:hypothetical protein
MYGQLNAMKIPHVLLEGRMMVARSDLEEYIRKHRRT